MADGVGTTHHIKLGSQYFLLRPGSYRKRVAPQFGARFTSGDPNYNTLTFWQHWAQTCWVGGLGAETWQDDAMYDEAVGMDTTVHEQASLARDMEPDGSTAGQRATYKWDMGGSKLQREFVVFNNFLYVMNYGDTTGNTATGSRLYRFDPAGNVGLGQWVYVLAVNESVRAVCSWSGKLWFGDGGGNMTYMNPNETTGSKAKPAGRTEVPYSMRVFRDRMYVGFGRFLWRMKTDENWDGSTVFYEAIGVNYFIGMELHLGFLYLLSQNGHVLRTDGNNTFDIWSWDGGVAGASLRSYDGRLFVATNEAEETSGANQGVLYQFTGSAVTELKRWGKVGRACSLGRMRVAFRRLYYGASDLLGMQDGAGVAVYDSVEDAHSIFACYREAPLNLFVRAAITDVEVNDVFFWQGYLYSSVRGFGIFRSPLVWKDVTRGTSRHDISYNSVAAGSKNGGWIESSDFDAGTPGLRKYWAAITVHADCPANSSYTVEYSLDGGKTWAYPTGAAATSTVTAGGRAATQFRMNSIVGPRFKYRVTIRSSVNTATPLLLGVIVRYLPQPDPNWMWEFTAVISDRQELLDGSVVDVNVATTLATFDSMIRAQAPVNFVDIDGTQWAAAGAPGVLIYDTTRDVRYIGPSSAGGIEAEIHVTLLEAVEAYV